MKQIPNYVRYLLISIACLVVCLIIFVMPRKNISKKTMSHDTQEAAGTGIVIEEKIEIQSPFPMAETGQNMPSQIQTTKTYIQGRKIRSDSGDHTVIFDFDKRMFYSLNPGAKTYTEMTLEQFREAQKQALQWINEMNAQMEESLKTLPEDSRKDLMEKLKSLNALTEPKKPAEVTVKATGKRQMINAYPCDEYEVFEDGEKSAVAWLTTSISTKEYDSYQKEMKQWMTDLTASASNPIEEWEYLNDKGFPIKITRLNNAFGNISINREVTHAEMQSLSDTIFQPPVEYTRQNIPYPGTITSEGGATTKPEALPFTTPVPGPAPTEKDLSK